MVTALGSVSVLVLEDLNIPSWLPGSWKEFVCEASVRLVLGGVRHA